VLGWSEDRGLLVCHACAYAVFRVVAACASPYSHAMTKSSSLADAQSWLLLMALAAIWGGSFMFIGVAVKELPALLIVLARVAMASAILLPIHFAVIGKLPTNRKSWIACAGMSIMNNVIPFTLISWGQHHIASGLASVINATTPMFAAIFMAMAAYEAITLRKTIALLVGLAGVIILQGADVSNLGDQSLGILAVIGGAAFYGLSAPWSKKMLGGIPPLTIATCQLLVSTLIMAVIVLPTQDLALYAQASLKTWAALIALAALATSLAYLLFFRIIARAGPSFVSLVTMLVPVSAIALGYLFLDETLSNNEIIGTLIIGLSLVLIDGRALRYIGITTA
jgi:drug/metabolite transporter (DMT)-like permease